MKIALTCDDAPTILGDGGYLNANPDRLDTVREVLLSAGVTHCVAFVIGSAASDEDDRLRRWLEAGYELGNHTFNHLNASEHDSAAFLDDVRRCDELLTSLGAFDGGRPRYFRFPFLSRGDSPASRGEDPGGTAVARLRHGSGNDRFLRLALRARLRPRATAAR